MDIYLELAQKIIKAQEDIIGPIALDQARKVPGLTVGNTDKDLTFNGDKKDVVNKLVEQYAQLFGQVSVEACRSAVRKITLTLTKDQLPPLLA